MFTYFCIKNNLMKLKNMLWSLIIICKIFGTERKCSVNILMDVIQNIQLSFVYKILSDFIFLLFIIYSYLNQRNSMKKDDKIDRFNYQLQKLTKLLQQQSQFHNKYILNFIEKVPTEVSSNSSGPHQDLPFINMNTQPCVNENRSKKKERSLQSDFDKIALTPNFYQNEQSQIKRRAEATAPITRLYSQLELDKQVTTKSIKITPFQYQKYAQSEQNAQIEWKEQQLEEDDKHTVIMTFQRKNRYCTLVNKNNEEGISYENSAAATQNIQISFDREAIQNQAVCIEAVSKTHPIRQKQGMKGNAKMSLDIKINKDKNSSINMKTCTHTKKPSQCKNFDNSHNANQKKTKDKERGRPHTSVKAGNLQNMSKKNSYNPSCVFVNSSKTNQVGISSNDNTRNKINLSKIHKNQLEKLEEETLKERKATTRKNKTKRGQIEPKVKCTIKQQQKNFIDGTKQFLEIRGCNEGEKNRVLQKRLSNDQLGNLNQGSAYKSSGKNFIKTDGSLKKLNKVNFSKLQQNFKKEEQLAYQKKIVLNKFPKNQSKRHTVNQNFQKQNIDKKNSIIIKTTSVAPQRQYYIDNAFVQIKERNGLIQAAQQFQAASKIVERLDFDKKVPIMQRMLEQNNVFMIYSKMADRYNEISKKMNNKYFKALQLQITSVSEQAHFKLKAVEAVIYFFCQFFRPNNKNNMSILAKYKSLQETTNFMKINSTLNNQMMAQGQKNGRKISIFKGKQFIKENVQENTNINSVMLNCLQSCQLTQVIQSLPSYLYSNNVLCDESIEELLYKNQQIHQQIDNQGRIEIFMLKKSIIFLFLHKLVQFVKFLCQFSLIQRVQRHNIRVNRIGCVMVGYYSSRSRRQQHQSQQKILNKNNKLSNGKSADKYQNRKGYESERKITEGMDTDRSRRLLENKVIKTQNNSSCTKNMKFVNNQNQKQVNRKKKQDNENKKNMKQGQKRNPGPISGGINYKLSQSRQRNHEVAEKQ